MTTEVMLAFVALEQLAPLSVLYPPAMPDRLLVTRRVGQRPVP
jgi:hypothetical protein